MPSTGAAVSLVAVRVRSMLLTVTAVLLLAGITACGDSPTSPDNNAPYSQVDLLLGTGAEARASSILDVHYTGWFYNESATDQKGVQFDSSRGGSPFAFTLGAGQVISGWDQGMVGMRVGGVRRLIIPPSLAYGAARNGPIPPHATLVFDVELLGVR